MKERLNKFLTSSEEKAFDSNHKEKLGFNISQYDKTVVKGKQLYSDLELAKKRAAHIKHKVIANLDKHLVEFETNFTSRGGKVIWAEDGNDAVTKIIKVMENVQAKSAVKGKSMTTEELMLNEALEKHSIEPVETDLGEYIVQLAGEKPYHIVTPAMHKSKEDVAELFHNEKGMPKNSTPEEITTFVRNVLRKKFTEAEVGITGANFMISDIGGIAITENEGNALLTTSFPNTHIAIVGIEKMIPFMKDLDLYWSLLATHGTGQHITVYNSIITGPRQDGEEDGPDNMYVVILDNGRTDLLAEPDKRDALNCIRCGACLNGCPIYKNIGGHSYESAYSGPIGSIITPHYKGMKEFKHLSYASSLCGKCTEVCPMKIDLHKLLLYNRNQSVNENLSTKQERWSMILWKKGMLSRKVMDKLGSRIKNIVLEILFNQSWGQRRSLPKLSKKSFNQMWREKTQNNT